MVNPALMVLVILAGVMRGANVSRERSEVLWRQRAAQYAEQPDAAAFPQLARFHGQKSAWQRRAGCAFGTANVAERSCEVCLRTTFCCLLGDPKILEDRRRRGEEKRREVEAVKAVSRLYSEMLGRGGGLGDWISILVGGARIARGLHHNNATVSKETSQKQKSIRKAMRETVRLSKVRRALQWGAWSSRNQVGKLLESQTSAASKHYVLELPSMEHYMRYSVGVYGWRLLSIIHPNAFHMNAGYFFQDERAFQSYAQTDRSDILKIRLRSETFRPAYALCVDHVSKSVVLAVRGTLDPADLLTDAVAYSLPFLDRKQRKVGYAHMGILRASEELLEELREPLAAAMRKYRRYHLVLCGHSLGGGCAALLGALLKHREKNVGYKFRAYAFGPPPVACQGLSRTLEDEVLSTVVGDDAVCRLSIHALLELGWRAGEASKNPSSSSSSSTARPAGGKRGEAHELYLPGTVLLLGSVNAPRSRGIWGWAADALSALRGTRQATYTMDCLDHTRTGEMQHIVISSRMFLDHFPSMYEKHIFSLRHGGLSKMVRRFRGDSTIGQDARALIACSWRHWIRRVASRRDNPC